jgi:hypothetical protein
MDFSITRKWLRFAYGLSAAHFVFLCFICFKDLDGIVERIGMLDFPLTLVASPVLMNIDLSIVWIVLYYAVGGTLWWYVVGRFLDRLIS